MYSSHTLYIALILVATGIAIGLAVYSWLRRPAAGATPFSILMFAIAAASLAYAFRLVSVSPAALLFWSNVWLTAISITPLLWLTFALQYTGRDERLKRRNIALLAVVPVLTVILAWTNAWHGLYWGRVWLETVGTMSVIRTSHGPWFWVDIVYYYLINALAMGIIVMAYVRSSFIYRRQATIILIGMAIPWLTSLVYGFCLSSLACPNLSPFGFALGGLVLALGLFRYRLLDLVPVARDQLIDDMIDGMIVLDTQGRVVDLNPMTQEILGIPAEQAIGQQISGLLPPWRQLLEGFSTLTGAKPEITIGERGSERHYGLRVSPLMDRKGQRTGQLVILRDVTEQRLATVETRKAKESAEAANRAKSAFLTNMSHELRTPLNAILGFTQLMSRDQTLSPEQQENLAIINRSGEHLLALINDVLEMSKIESGRAILHEEDFDLFHLLDGIEDMFRLKATQKGLNLVFSRADDVPRYVRTDQGKLRQVLMNVLGNAVKFTKQGEVTLSVRCYPQPDQDLPQRDRESRPGEAEPATCCRLFFEVQDTGPGIAGAEVASLFDPFVQTTSGRKSQEGTGLGLSISRQFVNMMGGDISVESKLFVGSVFKFDVLVNLADESYVASPSPKRQVMGLEPGQPAYRLLVVDDQVPSRRLLVSLLAPLGFEVREAANGQEAIEVWESWRPHLVWMDVRMPVLDGFEATRRIRELDGGRDAVIVALTASVFERDRETILSEGCNAFVLKPFREEQIFDTLTQHLGVRFVYREMPDTSSERGMGFSMEPRATSTADRQLTREDLVDLSPGWLTRLHKAALEADAEAIRDLTDEIKVDHESIAGALLALLDEFRFDIIVTVTQPEEELRDSEDNG